MNLISASKPFDNINFKSNIISPKRNKINLLESFRSRPQQAKNENKSSEVNINTSLAKTMRQSSNSPANNLLQTKLAIDGLLRQPSNLSKGSCELINYPVRSTIKNKQNPLIINSDYHNTQRSPCLSSTNERKKNLYHNNIFSEMLTKITSDNNKVLGSSAR